MNGAVCLLQQSIAMFLVEIVFIYKKLKVAMQTYYLLLSVCVQKCTNWQCLVQLERENRPSTKNKTFQYSKFILIVDVCKSIFLTNFFMFMALG